MGIWSQASAIARKTPEDRNRYVDFLRAASIIFVITGHWLIATAYYHGGTLEPGDMLKIQPWTRWLTWLFQVMPIFFIVGGYSNAVSLDSARRRGIGYPGWLAARLHRLVMPLLVLLLSWAALAIVLRVFGVSRGVIELSSQAALIPIWFLAIYIMIVLLAPATYASWRRWGLSSFWCFAALAMLVDMAYFGLEKGWLGWTNYFWVWLAVHQLGYMWRDGRFSSTLRCICYSAGGLAILVLLIFFGPYPIAMAGSPDDAVSNTSPPKITLLALGLFQFGLLLSVEAPARRLLSGSRLWTATVLVNSMIMTVYLWHVTIMVILVSLAYLADGFGLTLRPGSAEWWLTRPLWLMTLTLGLLIVAVPLSALERRSRPEMAAVPGASQQVAGAILICLGVAMLALYGYGGGPWQAFDVTSIALVLAGAGICGLLPIPHRPG